jgi:acyl-CoA synthetase (AMP-forming)/AMP-acid ligase II
MSGYFLRPEETRAAFTSDGWFRTGDLGYLDADGYLTVSGRIKEVIVRGGEKVMPREVEEVLEQHPNVLEAAVVGEPDGEHGEVVVAFVAPGEVAPTVEELRAFCRGRMAEFKVPRRFVIAADLPRGPTGKVLKRALKDWRPGPGASEPGTVAASNQP